MPIDRTAYNALVDDDGSGLTGSVWDKAKIASVLLDPIDAYVGGLQAYRVGLFHSALQAVAHDTLTAVTFDSEDYDVTGLHSAVNPTRVTIPTGGGGVYRLTAHIVFASNTTGYRQVQFRKNGADVGTLATAAPVNGAATAVGHSTTLVLAAADYVEVFAYQKNDASASLNIGNATTRTVQNEFTVVKVS